MPSRSVRSLRSICAGSAPGLLFGLGWRSLLRDASVITEARELGADIEKVRDAATHSSIATTERYSRMRAKKATVIEVQKIRLAARNKPQTGDD